MKHLLLKPSVKAGIGDAILSLIVAISYARLTDRTLTVDWRGGMYGMPPEINLFDRIFEIKEIPYSIEIPKGNSVYPPVWKNSLNTTFEQLKIENNFTIWDRDFAIRNYSFDVSNFDYQEDILVMWDFDQFKNIFPLLIEKRIINNCDSELIGMGQIFNKYVQLKGEPLNYIESNWQSISNFFRSERVIGVHVRDTHESMTSYGSLKRNKYFNAVNSIMKSDKKAKSIFLATDNIEVQNEFISRYGNKVFFQRKWFDAPGSALHQSLDRCPDHWTNLLNALFDIFALSQCDYLVRRKKSSFSKISESIGIFDTKNVKLLDQDHSLRKKLSLVKDITKTYIGDIKYEIYN